MGCQLLYLHHLQPAVLWLCQVWILHHQSLRHVSPYKLLALFASNHNYFPDLCLLDYIPAHSRVYLTDKDLCIYFYALSLSTVVEYQTEILSGDSEAAAEILSLWLDIIKLFLPSEGTTPCSRNIYFISYFQWNTLLQPSDNKLNNRPPKKN